MKDLKVALLGSLLAGLAAAAYGAPRCSNGQPPKLSGDAFSPVECSTAALSAAALPDVPVASSKDAKTSLKDLDGRWEGGLVHALGRYAFLLTVKTSWGGKTELTLDIKELQFRERLTDRLALVPGKVRGVYEAVLTSSLAPNASLNGGAVIGAPGRPESPKDAQNARQVDLLFANGASHRIFLTVMGKNELRLRAYSAVPGAPLQTFETILARSKREAL
jgi:hypothetical protein